VVGIQFLPYAAVEFADPEVARMLEDQRISPPLNDNLSASGAILKRLHGL
jgi:hypothetical protein